MTQGPEPNPPVPPNPGPVAGGTRDPLVIPEVLQRPVPIPEYIRPKPPSAAVGGFAEVARALAIGIDFLCTLAAGGGLGWGADWLLGSSPVGLVIGVALGAVGGTYRLITRLNAAEAGRGLGTSSRPANRPPPKDPGR